MKQGAHDTNGSQCTPEHAASTAKACRKRVTMCMWASICPAQTNRSHMHTVNLFSWNRRQCCQTTTGNSVKQTRRCDQQPTCSCLASSFSLFPAAVTPGANSLGSSSDKLQAQQVRTERAGQVEQNRIFLGGRDCTACLESERGNTTTCLCQQPTAPPPFAHTHNFHTKGKRGAIRLEWHHPCLTDLQHNKSQKLDQLKHSITNISN